MHGDEESRQWILNQVRAISKVVNYDEINDDAFDALVYEVAAAGAAAVNNCGVPSQIEYLLKHGWSVDDIVYRLNLLMHEDEFDATAEYIKGYDE